MTYHDLEALPSEETRMSERPKSRRDWRRDRSIAFSKMLAYHNAGSAYVATQWAEKLVALLREDGILPAAAPCVTRKE